MRASGRQRRAAAHYAGLKTDQLTGLKLCWVCARAMDPVLHDAGFASHPCCDPAEVSDMFPPETEPAWFRAR